VSVVNVIERGVEPTSAPRVDPRRWAALAIIAVAQS